MNATVTCFDSVDVDLIPASSEAVLGYVGGTWRTYYTLESRFPKLAAAHRLVSVAIDAEERARMLDIESGDATPDEAPTWFRNNADEASGPAILYASASAMPAVIGYMSEAGIPRGRYLALAAHYGSGEHICSPSVCGQVEADGTQWTDRALDLNLDQSMLSLAFFPGLLHPPDPYRFFTSSPVPVPREWLGSGHPALRAAADAGGGYVIERAVVEEFDRLDVHPWMNRDRLHVVRQILVFLRKRVWVSAHEDLDRNGRPSWGVDYRGMRYQGLAHRTTGVTQDW